MSTPDDELLLLTEQLGEITLNDVRDHLNSRVPHANKLLQQLLTWKMEHNISEEELAAAALSFLMFFIFKVYADLCKGSSS